METNAARSDRPKFVPDSGEYSSPTEAKLGIRRLISYPGKRREDVLSAIIGVVESEAAGENAEVCGMAYSLIASLGSPQDDIEVRLFAKALSVLKWPNEAAVNGMAAADPTGTMAALLLMSHKTFQPAVSRICEVWAIRSRISGGDLKKRNAVIGKMIELSASGIARWENEHTCYPIAAVIKDEGWYSALAMSIVKGFKSLPIPLAEMAMNSAPESVKTIIIKKEAKNTDKMAVLVAALLRTTDEDDATDSMSRFMQDDTVSIPEKIKLYEFLTTWTRDDEGHIPFADMRAVRDAGLKLFASLPDQRTFDVALGKFFDGSDRVSIAELTGNIEFSALDYKSIMTKLEHDNLVRLADPKFVVFARTMEASEKSDADSEEEEEEDFGDVVLASATGIVRIGGMDMAKSTAIVFAVILVSIGMPMSLVLMRTGTTGSELASRPDLVQKGRQIARMSGTSEEYAEVVEKAKRLMDTPQPAQQAPGTRDGVSVSKPQAPRQAKPTLEQRRRAHEVTRQLVDAIVMLEHVPGKEFSSQGAGGLMQLMPETWEAINRMHFGGMYPFSRYAKVDHINRRFGTIYLGQIKDYLDKNRSQWKTDQLPLMFACYFGGIGNMTKANFDPAKIKKHYPKTYDYMIRGTNLMGYGP